MKKLRLAFLSAGRFVHIRPYIEFFKQRGHDVFWIKYDYSERTYGVEAYDLSCGARGDQKWSKWKYLLAGVSIRKVLREIRPDILHGHYITSAGVISWMSGHTRYVLTAHGSDIIASLQSPLWRYILRRVLTRAALVNPVSDELAKMFTAFGVPQEKLYTATLGVDIRHFAFQPRRPDGTLWRLLCTRTLSEVYDPQTILRACGRLRDKGLCFQMTFAAGGPAFEELKRSACQMNLGDNVRFVGGYDNAHLTKLLSSHDLFISASLWDGTSISLLEAMSVGVFPVVSRIPANTALLEDNKTALMFECGNESQLADAILRAIGDDRLRQMSIEANRQYVVEKADRAKNMLGLEKKYYALLGS